MGGRSRTPHPENGSKARASCPNGLPAGVLTGHQHLTAALVVEAYLPGCPGAHVVPGQGLDRSVDLIRRDERNHADAAVQRGLEVVLREVPYPAYDVEDRRRRPGRAVERDRDLLGQDPRQVGGEATARYVRHRVYAGGPGESEAGSGVDTRGLEQLLAESPAQLGHLAVEGPARLLEQDVPDEGVAVGMQSARRHGDHHVAGTDTPGA